MTRPAQILQLAPQRRADAVILAERGLREPLPVIRRIAFASLEHGTGCTTAATRAATVLAVRRSGHVLYVDATTPEHGIPRVLDQRISTDSVPRPVWPQGVAAWRTQCDERHRNYELTLTDWGALGITELQQVAAHSHLLCLTTTTERRAVQQTLDTAAFLRESGTQVLIVASAVREWGTVAERRMISSLPLPTQFLPCDLAARRLDTVVIGSASMLPIIELGAAIIRTSIGVTEAPTRPVAVLG